MKFADQHLAPEQARTHTLIIILVYDNMYVLG
jgi:hypothetical protein